MARNFLCLGLEWALASVEQNPVLDQVAAAMYLSNRPNIRMHLTLLRRAGDVQRSAGLNPVNLIRGPLNPKKERNVMESRNCESYKIRNNIALFVFTFLVCLGANGCDAYHGISKSNSNIYISGSTWYLFATSHWVKRCHEKKWILECQELGVEDKEYVGHENEATLEIQPEEKPNSSTPPEEYITSDDECRLLQECKQLGRCHARKGKCVKLEQAE